MSRSVIGAILAALIVVVTAAAYFLTTSKLEGRVHDDVERRVAKAQELLIQNSSLEMLGLLNHVKALSLDPKLMKALGNSGVDGGKAQGPDPLLAEEVFQKFRAGLSANEAQPDIMAMTDDEGHLLALMSAGTPLPNPVPDSYLKSGKIKYPALVASIENQIVTSEIWNYEGSGAMKVTVAPILDPEVNTTLGTVLVAYAITAPAAKKQHTLLGAHVVYFLGDNIQTTSFGNAKEQQKAFQSSLFSEKGLAKQALQSSTGMGDIREVQYNGETFLATSGRLPRHSSKAHKKDYPAPNAGAMVMISLSKASSSVGTAGMAILVVGFLSMLLLLGAIALTAKGILQPLEEIEIGVNDIINGNMDRVFEPAGSDVDGLGNALNVMLAKILGRAEPGEEEFDENGNIIRNQPSLATAPIDPKQAAAEALAAEPTEAYLKRIHQEFSTAQHAQGETKTVGYQSFVKNLHSNEAALKQKYGAREVRFRVVTEGGKVTLKPVPIM